MATMSRSALALGVALLAAAPPTAAALEAHSIEYEIDGEMYEGYIAYELEWVFDPRPAVMVIHNRDGVEETEKLRARELAERGYVGFAHDMLGKGCRGDPCGREAVARLRADPELLRHRAASGLDVVARQPFADASRLGANGYCFGGTVVLEMARVGMAVDGVVSFHGGLVPLTGDTAIPASIGVQVHTGDLDPITENDLDDMNEEMRSAGLDYWASFIYGNCAHSWTDPMSGAYRQREGDESHAIMMDFYDDVFAGNATATAAANGGRMANEADHIKPLMQPSPETPLARERAQRIALEAELAQARALIGNLQRSANASRSI
jgi:dienelactone hydrolase